MNAFENCRLRFAACARNAHRLSVTLYQMASDPGTVKALALLLNYNPDVLARDMKDIDRYIDDLEDLLEGEEEV